MCIAVFDAMQDQLRNLVENFMAAGDVKRIIVTGHSLGEAVASIVAPYVQSQFNGVSVELTTFEAPKAFDKKSAVKVEEMLGLNNINRIADNNDIVTKVGHGVWRDGHVGEAQNEW